MVTFEEYAFAKYPLWQDKELGDFHISVKAMFTLVKEYLEFIKQQNGNT